MLWDYIQEKENVDKIIVRGNIPPINTLVRLADGTEGTVSFMSRDAKHIDPVWAEKHWDERIRNGNDIIGITLVSGDRAYFLAEDDYEIVLADPYNVARLIVDWLYDEGMIDDDAAEQALEEWNENN